VLGAVDVDPQGDHATVFAEVHPIDHERDQPGEHPIQRHPPEDLARGEQLVGRHR
jgi:hypothetical protein